MKIIKESWESRYKKLAIEVDCKQCGAKLLAESIAGDFKFKDLGYDNFRIIIRCPTCKNEIDIQDEIRKVDSEMISFILNKKAHKS